MKTATVKARVVPEIVQQLDAIVDANTGDRSDHIRQALIEYIARHPQALQAEQLVPLAEPVEA